MKKPLIIKVLQILAFVIIVAGILGSLLMAQTPPAESYYLEETTTILNGTIFLIGSLSSLFAGCLLLGLREIILQLFEGNQSQKKSEKEK